MLQKKDIILCHALITTMAMMTPTLAQRLNPTLEEHHINTHITMRYAATQVTSQMYNPNSVSITMNYTLLLPEKAFVTAFSMISDGKEYFATIQDAEFADETYSRIESLYEEAGLIAKRSRETNVFEVSMTARPLKRVTFKLTHEQMLVRKKGLYTLPIHLHPGERSENVSVTVDIAETSPIKHLQMSKFRAYDEQGEFKKNSVAIVTKINDRSARIMWNPIKKRNFFNGVMTVQYDVGAFDEIYLDKDGNFVQIFKVDDKDRLPKHVVFVLDISGSMHGQKIEKMKEAMSTILDDLSQDDEFSLIFFSSKVMIWTGSTSCHVVSDKARVPNMAVLSVTPVNISKAKKCIGTFPAFGGTDINKALEKAMEASKIALERNERRLDKLQLMIMFLTDGIANGLVRDPLEIRKKFTEKNREVKASLFGLGFGDDADFKFLKEITLHNRGFAKKIYDAKDAAKQLEDFYRSISSPSLSNVKFIYNDDEKVTLETPDNIPIVFDGTSIMQVGKVEPGSGVSGIITSEQGDMIMAGATLVSGKHAEYLKRLTIYLTIQDLLEKTDKQSRDKARSLALENGFVTKETSLIVTRPYDEPVIAFEEPVNFGRSSSFYPIEEFEDPPDEIQTPFTGLALEDIEWLTPLGNDSYAMPEIDNYVTNLKIAGRQYVIGYNSCITPDDNTGHCYNLRHCVLSDFQDNFDTFIDYFCNIQNRFVGVCCPDELTT